MGFYHSPSSFSKSLSYVILCNVMVSKVFNSISRKKRSSPLIEVKQLSNK
jgi:hypothetical protein